MAKKIVILYSSGLDSRIMLHLAQVTHPDAEIKCLYYAHGAESEAEEIARLPAFVEVRRIDWLNDKIKPLAKKEDEFGGAFYIPGRNLIFTSLAACQELPDEIYMGVNADENYPKSTDKGVRFRDETSALLSYVLSPFSSGVQIVLPFVDRNWCKKDTVKWALENGLTPKDITDTISCYHHHGVPCGECRQCVKRKIVFMVNNLDEEYVVDPLTSAFGINSVETYLQMVYRDKEYNMDEETMAGMIMDLSRQGRLPQVLEDLVQKYTK